jgi:hypothetical protein
MRAFPENHTVRAALALAARAPSANNSQPWLWDWDGETLELHTARERLVRETDPAGNRLLLSCGAVLHHARVALASLGWRTAVQRIPDPGDPGLLARITFTSGVPDAEEADLAAAIPLRRSDRQPYRGFPLGLGSLAQITAPVKAPGVVLGVADDRVARGRLVRALADVERMRLAGPARLLELAAADPERWLDQLEPVAVDNSATVVVIGTRVDDRSSRLCAGEAASQMVLSATTQAVATCIVLDPLESEDVREAVSTHLLHGACPQVVVRMGRSGGVLLPWTPRRELAEFLRDHTSAS